MLTLQSVEGKVLVEYHHAKDIKIPVFIINEATDGKFIKGYQIQRGPIRGMVVAIDDGVIGWSLCNKKDIFNKEIAIDMAMKRAIIASKLSLKSRNNFYSRIPFSLNDEFLRMEERSEKYFNYDSN